MLSGQRAGWEKGRTVKTFADGGAYDGGWKDNKKTRLRGKDVRGRLQVHRPLAQEAAVGRCFLEGVFPSLVLYLHRAGR